MTASSRTTRPNAIVKSREKEPIEDVVRPLCNISDRCYTHLKARCNLATSKRREDLPIISHISDEINELRARLKKLAARNIEAAPSISTSPFSAEIQ